MANRMIRVLCGCAASALLAGTDAAVAQTVPPAAADQITPADSTNRIEEVVVTAQKRSQKSQDVPVSIAAFSAATLNNAGIQNVSDLGAVAPGLQITQNGGVITPFLRGVGNDATTVGNESSVAVYLDDVYQPRLNNGVLELSSVDHIEVLKGPQGTLFGRNASGGLINIFTRNPTQTPTAELTLGIDNYLTELAKGYVAGGTQTVFLRIYQSCTVIRTRAGAWIMPQIRNSTIMITM